MALDILKIILLSMLPVSELRGAVPYGITFSNMPPYAVFFIAVAANMLVVPIVYFFLDHIHHYLLPISLYHKLFWKYVERTKSKAHKYTSKYGYIGLMLFVAVPLPATGAYTGTLAAWLLGMERKKATLAIIFGVLIAGIIMTVLSLAGARSF